MEKLKIYLIVLITILLIFPQTFFAQIPKNSFRASQTADLLIVGGTVVTMNAAREVIEDGAVVIRGNSIAAVGKTADIVKNYRAKQTIDARGRVVVPGLVNTHTHIPMGLFRGIADDLDLQDWLTKYIFPAEKRNVDEAFVRAGTRLGLAELVRGGTTTFCDMYYFEDAIADETARAGVRGVLGETLIDFPAPDNKTFDDAVRYTETFVRKWQGHALIVPAVAPHAPYTVSPEHLMKTRELSDRLNAPLVIHLAEAETETAFIQQKHQGIRPIEFMEQIGFLSDKTIAAHVVQADDAELEILKRHDVGIAHNPQSNMKLAAGVAPVPLMLKKEMRVGLGTDGAASNNDLSLWEEMDTAAKLHKVFSKDPKVVSAEEVFMMATIGGARALHLENLIGSIETGKRADLVIVDFDNLNQTPFYNVYSTLVYATKADDVRTVLIDGKTVMRDKRLLTLDENVIKKDANLYRQKIINSLSSN
ncbi:MAG: amidohydrolase [Acidobacteria bacterium]|nr:amidohydrolase [Acidobacteriota bacterium]